MARNIKKEVQKHKERSYTNKDFKSLRNELRRYALTHFRDNIVDFSDASMGGLILDLASYVGDVMTFYMDHQFNENSIENAVDRNNLERLIRESGLDIPGPSPAFAEITMEIDPASFEERELYGFINAGVNRFSLGAQSFNNQILKKAGRRHK